MQKQQPIAGDRVGAGGELNAAPARRPDDLRARHPGDCDGFVRRAAVDDCNLFDYRASTQLLDEPGYRRGCVQGRDNCTDLFVFPPPPSIARGGGKGGGGASGLLFRHLVLGEVLEDADQAGVVPAFAAEGGGGDMAVAQ